MQGRIEGVGPAVSTLAASLNPGTPAAYNVSGYMTILLPSH